MKFSELCKREKVTVSDVVTQSGVPRSTLYHWHIRRPKVIKLMIRAIAYNNILKGDE